MMRNIRFVLASILLIVSCSSDKKNPTDAINNFDWNVTQIGGISTFERTPTFQIKIENNKIEGSTGCNRFFGNISLEGHKMSVQNVGATKMACNDMQTEIAFLKALKNVTHFEIEKDKLKLLSEDSKVLMYLKKSSE